mgnify:CR=1 FL=1
MISGTEYLVIALAAFLIFGPRRLPELSRKLGGYLREARVVVAQVRASIEAETGPLTEPIKEMTEPLREVTEEARKLRDEGKAALDWKGPVHGSGPTPDDALADLESIEEGTTEETEDEGEGDGGG